MIIQPISVKLITRKWTFLGWVLLLLAGCSMEPRDVNDMGPSDFQHRAEQAQNDEDNWLLHGRSYGGERFSPLTQINEDSVAQLGLSWYLDLPRDGGQEATPLIIDGVMYFTTTWSVVYAVDATSGSILWKFDPEVPKKTLGKACCGPVNRGVAYWDGKVYVGTLDGRLVALDASSGSNIWSTRTFDESERHTITGAPRVFAGKVIIGNGGAEFAARGFVTTYDANTGEQLWRFYTVPGDPSKPFENPILEEAAKTWYGEWWRYGGGGTVWDSISYDPETNLVYVGVGNGGPWNPGVRSEGKGDNLFVSSIVALNADDGRYVWHYQTTPGDGWDYTATQNMIFADLTIEGQPRKVIMQAPKNGFFYVLDRVTGEPLSAESYVKVTWASHIDGDGRPVINPRAKYWETGEHVTIFPGSYGGHNWKPMAYHPDLKLVYIPATESLSGFKPADKFEMLEVGRNNGVDYRSRLLPSDPKAIAKVKKLFSGKLMAWDPIKQKEVWSVAQPYPANGGVLTTAGNLVFQGDAAGVFSAYKATTGEQLWRFSTHTAIMAPPVTYRVKGEQYVAVQVGRGGIIGRIAGRVGPPEINRSRLLVFKLNGDQVLPSPDEPTIALPDLSNISVDPLKVTDGAPNYAKFCAPCHGFNGVAGGVAPDLRYSPFIRDRALFDQVVIDGLLEANGMVSFAPSLSAEEVEAVRHYLIHENQLSRQFGETSRVGR